jgi:hypothetical protein
MVKGAMFNRYAMNAKRASEKKMFDADKARIRLDKDDLNWKDSRETEIKQERYLRMRKSLKGYTPVFQPNRKGG